VQGGYDLWNAGEMEVAKVMFAPDLVMSTPPDWPDAITSSSRDEPFARLVENKSLFERDKLVPERCIEAGDCVIVPTLDLHRRAVEAFDTHDVEAFIALMDPSIEAHSVFAAVGAVYHGHDGLRRFLEMPGTHGEMKSA
jgi:ketosteroid isomerase-like protein